MTMNMELSPRNFSSVMQTPSVVNNAEDPLRRRMDILMILNPSNVELETEDHSINNSAGWENVTRVQHEPSHYLQQPEPISSENTLVRYQAELEALETRNHTLRYGSGRTQLPLAPIHRRPLTFNPINVHHGHTSHYPLPPIYPSHNGIYNSSSPAHRQHHNHPHRSRRSQTVSTSNRKKPRSNKAYSMEEVDFIRYNKDDLNKHWPEILSLFRRHFIQRQRDSEQCLSSRYYRSNHLKMYDASGRPMLDKNGKVRKISAKVRRRATPAGRVEALPYTLVQKHPQRAMAYSWVSSEHKFDAGRLAAGMSDHDREILISQRVQQLRNEKGERAIPVGERESKDESMDEGYEGSSTTSSPQFSSRPSP
ncbi:hypothetical protein SBOR_9945 [Sclerotinia borealis F-4128]|uniref:Uncharacterized protein n=1 Tax=Sclerotinia borealis (strain F-4128) TaxID=1432307 RepID=W9C506_SCLBF|nr:hypothetical protein SBOR_9945 [Sclerotinia borealis F-4128]